MFAGKADGVNEDQEKTNYRSYLYELFKWNKNSIINIYLYNISSNYDNNAFLMKNEGGIYV